MKLVAIVIIYTIADNIHIKKQHMKYLPITIATFFISSTAFANEKAPTAITNDIFSFLTHPIVLGGIIALIAIFILVIATAIYWKYKNL